MAGGLAQGIGLEDVPARSEFRLLGDFSPTCLPWSLAARAILENGETMNQAVTLFVSTFTTLLAIINPLESLPVFLNLLQGNDRRAHRQVAWRACTYATLLLSFFPIFGTFLLDIFEVPLSMVRIVGASS